MANFRSNSQFATPFQRRINRLQKREGSFFALLDKPTIAHKCCIHMATADRYQNVMNMRRILRSVVFRHPEVVVLVCYGIIVYCISILINTKFSFPSRQNSIFIGIHYGAALILGGTGTLIGIIFNINMLNNKKPNSIIILIIETIFYLLVFVICIWLHFHIKMWIPLINIDRYDELYYKVDLFFISTINIFLILRNIISSFIGNVDYLYTNIFILMFVISFFFHSVWDKRNIRPLFMATLLVHAGGSLSYLVMPAVGPFIYQKGLSSLATMCQSGMWEAYQVLRTQGPSWLNENAPRYFTAGLAAMPSLHVGASWVFLHYAHKSLKYLLVLYIPFFLWIIIEAVAAKWHYLIDLPTGVALGYGCIRLAEKLEDQRERCDVSRPGMVITQELTDSNRGNVHKTSI